MSLFYMVQNNWKYLVYAWINFILGPLSNDNVIKTLLKVYVKCHASSFSKISYKMGNICVVINSNLQHWTKSLKITWMCLNKLYFGTMSLKYNVINILWKLTVKCYVLQGFQDIWSWKMGNICVAVNSNLQHSTK